MMSEGMRYGGEGGMMSGMGGMRRNDGPPRLPDQRRRPGRAWGA